MINLMSEQLDDEIVYYGLTHIWRKGQEKQKFWYATNTEFPSIEEIEQQYEMRRLEYDIETNTELLINKKEYETGRTTK